MNEDKKEFKEMTDVKDYDYLLGMVLWMLTDEGKNQLLKQRDDKIMDFNVLKEKTPADLWREDLNELAAKLDEVEEKERQHELESNKQDATKPKGGREQETISYTNSSPSTSATTMEPKLTGAVKKATKAIRDEKEKTTSTLNSSSQDQMDEFDIVFAKYNKTLKDKRGPKRKNKLELKKSSKAKKSKCNFPSDESGSESDFSFPPRERISLNFTFQLIWHLTEFKGIQGDSHFSLDNNSAMR